MIGDARQLAGLDSRDTFCFAATCHGERNLTMGVGVQLALGLASALRLRGGGDDSALRGLQTLYQSLDALGPANLASAVGKDQLEQLHGVLSEALLGRDENDLTRLHRAVIAGDVARVGRLVRAGAPLEATAGEVAVRQLCSEYHRAVSPVRMSASAGSMRKSSSRMTKMTHIGGTLNVLLTLTIASSHA